MAHPNEALADACNPVSHGVKMAMKMTDA